MTMETTAKLSHAYIIAGQPEAALVKARELAGAMLCTGPEPRPCGRCRNCRKVGQGIHPDVLITVRQTDDKGRLKREIYVDQIRDIAATAAILPGEAERKVYIIRDAGTMNPAAQNALLKLLEEPPTFDAFLLLTDSADRLLETVRSRCVTLAAETGSGEDAPPAEARARAEEYLDIAAARARVSLLSFANRNGELGNAEMLDFVRSVRLLLSDMLCSRLPDRKLPRAEQLRLAALTDRAEAYLRFNVSTKHVLGLLSVETIQGTNEEFQW